MGRIVDEKAKCQIALENYFALKVLVIFQERLVSEKPLTLQELGDKYGVTKERARQIEEQIKGRLRQYVKDNFPDYDILTESM